MAIIIQWRYVQRAAQHRGRSDKLSEKKKNREVLINKVMSEWILNR